MDPGYDREKVIDCMFDPITSSLIAELENGEIESNHLSQKSSIAEDEIKERFSYLIDCKFIIEKNVDGKLLYSANVEKLSEVVEDGENFGAAIEGLEKMDSFLN